ncbi:MAG TPA: 3-phosphoshikimate 1-carboxyvinyltransferase [Clostridiales bacterium]|nr:3-phosphoshikimate 1-carboxyvinyltransferase [Clostridiales bacterium]
MTAKIVPTPLRGTISAVTSKSDAHRLLICAALADGQTRIVMRGTSDDINATIFCLRALGAKVDITPDGVYVEPIKEVPSTPVLDCAESGSTLRFLLPVAAALGANAKFVGRGRLPERPIGELTSELNRHGVQVSSYMLPLEISGRLTGGSFNLPGNVSSQFVTGLLLALPLCGGGSVRITTPLESAPYVDITCADMRKFGVQVAKGDGIFAVPPNAKYRSPGKVASEGDWSGAAFFLAAGALSGEVAVTGLDLNSPQGDKEVANLLQKFGAEVEISKDVVIARHAGKLRGCEIDVAEIPDLLPVLAAVASAAEGATVFTGARRLRLKESDRIASTAAMIRALGGTVEEREDGLVVFGGGLGGGEVDSFGDHRIAMAAAVAATVCSGEVKIKGPMCVAKSYPDFWSDYKKLGGVVLGI